jgi:biopolymer transport protein ExbD
MQFAPPRRGSRTIINVTSLIDVMFLLLIFFLVTSTFKQQPAIRLDLPRSTTAEAVAAGPAVLYLTSDGDIYLDERRLERDEVVPALEARLADGGEDHIVLRADTSSEYGAAVALMDLIRESGFSRVDLSARPAGGRLDGEGGAP